MKRLAIIGCGFVANYYMLTLSKSETLKVVGVLDLNAERAAGVAKLFSVPRIYQSFTELLADDSVDIVVNLTNPRNHYDLTRAALEAGKHVYSEKPLAMTIEEAKSLVEVAQKKSLQLSCAPCSMLGEAAQTVWQALRQNKIGRPLLVYAEMEEDMIHKAELHNLKTKLGSPWPAQDEFEIGLTLEHAGYYLPWLAAFFGPAKRITAFASCLVPDKIPGVVLDPPDAPDFTVSCIEFASGVVARLTVGLAGREDRTMTLFGETGVLHVENAWDYASRIRLKPRRWNEDSLRTPAQKFWFRVWRKLKRHLPFLEWFEKLPNPHGEIYPPVREVPAFDWEMGLHMDFSRGIQEMADAIDEKRASRLSNAFSLHVNELSLAIHHARKYGQPYEMTTTFEPIAPMPWAE